MEITDIWSHPNKADELFRLTDFLDRRREYWDYISWQLMSVKNIGVDYNEDYPDIFKDPDSMGMIVDYVDKNYLSVHSIDDILGDDIRVCAIGRMLYKFFVLYFPKEVLPGIINSSDYTLETILTAPNLRELIISFIFKSIDTVDNVLRVVDINSMTIYRYELLFYSELVDNNLDRFVSNYLIPLTHINYDMLYGLIE
jgi:hypothetical protein